MLQLLEVENSGFRSNALVFSQEHLRLLISVNGVIGNSIPSKNHGKATQIAWRRAVMAAAKTARGVSPLRSEWVFSVTAAFRFHPRSHGNRSLDVENFLKPTFDALAAGLFCAESTNPEDVSRYGYDDSGFRHLYVHRLPDVSSANDEGVLLVVSVNLAEVIS